MGEFMNKKVLVVLGLGLVIMLILMLNIKSEINRQVIEFHSQGEQREKEKIDSVLNQMKPCFGMSMNAYFKNFYSCIEQTSIAFNNSYPRLSDDKVSLIIENFYLDYFQKNPARVLQMTENDWKAFETSLQNIKPQTYEKEIEEDIFKIYDFEAHLMYKKYLNDYEREIKSKKELLENQRKINKSLLIKENIINKASAVDLN